MNPAILITSTANPRVKEIRKLRERKYRAESGLYFIEGLRIVGEASRYLERMQTLVISPELLTSAYGKELAVHLREKGIEILEVSAEVFATLSGKDGPQGLAAVMCQQAHPLPHLDPTAPALFIALDSVQDPGNLGTVLRTADAVAAQGVILLGNCTDAYDPAVVRGSMGAVFSVPVIKTEYDGLFAWCAAQQLAVVGTSDSAAQHYAALSYPRRMLLLMGSEQKGLSAEVQARVGQMARIPMAGRSDSLNLAVATAVMLYEITGQHAGRKPHKEEG